jgi:hypothetical protein
MELKRPVAELAKSPKFQATYGRIDVTRRLFDLLSYQPSITMRFCWPVFAVAIICFATPSIAEPSPGSRLLKPIQNPDDSGTSARPVILVSDETERREPDTTVFASMSGKCRTLRIVGRDFACKAVAFYQTEKGRANFTIVLDDPADNSHIITFSGENGRKERDDLYELSVDRMLLRSKDRPKIDGLPAPLVEVSTGICKQLGNFATGQVSSISCIATGANGKKYELQFETDGSPIRVMRVRETPVPTERQRARQVEQFECRLKADAAKILRRDLTAYIIGCMGEDSQDPATAAPQ